MTLGTSQEEGDRNPPVSARGPEDQVMSMFISVLGAYMLICILLSINFIYFAQFFSIEKK